MTPVSRSNISVFLGRPEHRTGFSDRLPAGNRAGSMYILAPKKGAHAARQRNEMTRWVNRVVLTLRRLLPIFPDKQTFSDADPRGFNGLNAALERAIKSGPGLQPTSR
jgi:hypothetical protein